MRRGIALVAIGLLGLAGLALAAYRPGTYRGATAKGGAVSFKASSSAVTGFRVSVPLRCSNGASAANTTTLSRIPIHGGRFSTTGPNAISGALSGSGAKGTASITVAKLPNGRNCRSGTIAWTARRGAKGGLQCAPVGAFNGTDLQVDVSCGGGEFDGFLVLIPRKATRADTSTAHLRCLTGQVKFADGRTSEMANCSSQDGTKLKSGRVIIRFDTAATCDDARKTQVNAEVVGEAEYGPFPVTFDSC